MSSNLAQCKALVAKSVAAGAKVRLSRKELVFLHIPRSPNQSSSKQALFLPEASDYIANSAAETISLVRPVTDSVFVLGLQEEARREKLAINVGIHEPAQGGKKVKNTLIWIDEQGDIVQRCTFLRDFVFLTQGFNRVT